MQHISECLRKSISFNAHIIKQVLYRYTRLSNKGETITCLNGNIRFLLVNIYKISKRVNEVH